MSGFHAMPKINRRTFVASSSAVLSFPGSRISARAGEPRVRVVGLKVDHIDTPLAVENPRPRLSWRLESKVRNVRQSAYRVLVARSEAALRAGRAELWDSGKVSSRKSMGIEYQG